KSIFNSHWIRDFGHFYGANIFMAESSATTGGLDSLLEPTGNIKTSQDKAARAFGCQKLFFGTNGTSTSIKIAVQAIVRPGDIVCLWDEAWFAYNRFSPFHRMRSGMGACDVLRERYASEAYRAEYAEFKKNHGKLDPKNPKLLDTHLLPDPDAVKLRVYATTSTHKSLSCFRQGSYIMVNDDCWESTEAAFKEAFFAHTSTSPNLQLIASLDVARRQAELECYELVGRSIELSLILRREVNKHPLISKYFSIATNAQMVPAQYRASGLEDIHAEGVSWRTIYDALARNEVVLDATRITLLCGSAGFDGTSFKCVLASKFD